MLMLKYWSIIGSLWLIFCDSCVYYLREIIMPTPFFHVLQRTFTLDKVASFDTSRSEHARELQLLIDAGDSDTYRKRLSVLEEHGHTFRLGDARVYETKNVGEKIDVHIALQVNGPTLTWRCWAPEGNDLYPQAFNDKFYHAVHDCDVKASTLSFLELNAGKNHYLIVNGQPITPADLDQHLQAFKDHEAHDLFFDPGEIDSIRAKFSEFYTSKTEEQHVSKASTEQTATVHQASKTGMTFFQTHGEKPRGKGEEDKPTDGASPKKGGA